MYKHSQIDTVSQQVDGQKSHSNYLQQLVVLFSDVFDNSVSESFINKKFLKYSLSIQEAYLFHSEQCVHSMLIGMSQYF